MHRVFPLMLTGSIELLQTGSNGSKTFDWSALNSVDRFVQIHYLLICLFLTGLTTVSFGFVPRWIREIDPFFQS